MKLELKNFNKDNRPFYKRWRFFLAWSAVAAVMLAIYGYFNNEPESFYALHPNESRELIFWAWLTANAITCFFLGAMMTVLDSFLDWFERKRKEWGWWGE